MTYVLKDISIESKRPTVDVGTYFLESPVMSVAASVSCCLSSTYKLESCQFMGRFGSRMIFTYFRDLKSPATLAWHWWS